MNKKSKYLLTLISLLLGSFCILILLLIKNESLTPEKIVNKNIFIKSVGLPDLAISNQYTYIRHRSLVSSYEIFNNGPEHIEFSPVSFSTSYGDVVK